MTTWLTQGFRVCMVYFLPGLNSLLRKPSTKFCSLTVSMIAKSEPKS